ncbi:MAG: tetratricopeptide repeat protein [Candidatus Hydrogenedentes bacterium]|nr:tetratricopeptide repeat protein [Candidatus Hydrogenedentota bacterium]
MGIGLIVLFCVDAALAVGAVWILVRRGPNTVGALRAFESVMLLVGALVIHALAVLACGVITQLTDGSWSATEQLSLTMAGLAGGAIPVMILGYLVAAGFAHSFTAALSGDRPASPIPSVCAEAERLVTTGDVDGAVQAYKRFYRQYPQSTRPLFDAAVLLMRKQRHQEAADLLREIMRINRDNTAEWKPSAHLLADLLQNHFDEPESADYLLTEIAKRGGEPQPSKSAMSRSEAAFKMDRARTMAGRGMTDEAVRLFQEIDRAHPSSPHAIKAAAVALESEGRLDEAYALYREIMRRFPQDVPDWALAAHRAALICINHLHRPDEARATARLLLQKAPGSSAARWAGAYLMDVNREAD